MIDASIYRGIQQPQAPDQMAQYGRMMQIRNMMDQGELAGIQRNKLVKDIASEDAFRQAFDSYDPANHTQTIAALYKADPMRAMQFEKSRLESRKLSGDIDNNAITQQANVLKWFRDRLSAVNDDAGMVQLKADLSNLPGGQMYAASIPQTFDPEWKKSRIMTAEELLLRTRPDRVQVNNGQTITFVDKNDPTATAAPIQMQATPGEVMTDRRTREENALARGVTIRGQDMTDARSREANANARAPAGYRYKADGTLEAIPGGPAEKDKALTESQGNATGFGMRARESANIIDQLEKGGTFGRMANIVDATRQGLERVPVVGTAAANTVGAVGNMALTAAQQKYEQAKGDFKRAVLRKESGATISPSEDDAADRQYFPQAGDSKEVIEQKRRNRETAINALRVQAGAGGVKIPQGVNPANLSDDELKRELGL